MNEFSLKKIALVGLIFWGIQIQVWGITPGEVFEDGRRAFLLGNWLEAREKFSRFNYTWPTHPLAPKALYFGTLAEIRAEKLLEIDKERNRIASYTEIIKLLSERERELDLTEIKASVDLLKSKIEKTASAPSSLELPPETLKHYLNRGWVPDEFKNPFLTIKWIKTWLEKHPKCPPELFGRLQLQKAKALWEFSLSPLPSSAFSGTLEMWGCWPLKRALDRSLKEAFTTGSLDVKREAALLGICSDYLESKQRKLKPDSHWMQYLRERGIDFSEGWCPR